MDSTALSRARAILSVTALTLVLVFLAFGRSLWQGFAPLDDGFLIVWNLAVRGFTRESFRLAFTTYDPELYIPLTLVSFQLNYVTAGLQPWMYHLTNLLLHAANALLVMGLLRMLLTHDSSRTREGARLAVILCGLLFAVHPLHTEAVVWIAGRKDLLSTFFALLSFIAYLRYRKGSRRAYALSIVTFLLALLAKVTPLTLPVAFLLADLLLERRKDGWRMLTDKIPFLLLSTIFGLVAMGGKERVLTEEGYGGAFLLAGKSMMFYTEKLLLPLRLNVYHPYRGAMSLTEPRLLIPSLLLLGLLGLGLRRRSHS